MKRLVLLLVLTLLIIVTGMASIGCDGFRKYSFEVDFAKCTFDVPIIFGPISVDNSTDNFATLWGSSIKDNMYYLAGSVSKVSSAYPDYKPLLEDQLTWAKQGQQENEFELLERSAITIDGETGEKIVYIYTVHHESIFKEGKVVIPEPTRWISCKAFFDKEDILWNIEISAVIEKQTDAEATFQRILNTFEFK